MLDLLLLLRLLVSRALVVLIVVLSSYYHHFPIVFIEVCMWTILIGRRVQAYIGMCNC